MRGLPLLWLLANFQYNSDATSGKREKLKKADLRAEPNEFVFTNEDSGVHS